MAHDIPTFLYMFSPDPPTDTSAVVPVGDAALLGRGIAIYERALTLLFDGAISECDDRRKPQLNSEADCIRAKFEHLANPVRIVGKWTFETGLQLLLNKACFPRTDTTV